jgi:hypothetical protein
VSVLVKGTKFGTQTDFDGKYAINASPSQILFSVTWDENPRIKSDVITCKHNDGGEAVELEGVTINVLVLNRKNCQVQLPPK